jgi:hypothetical protein
MFLLEHEGVIEQLNIEGIRATNGLVLSTCRSLAIIGLHFEYFVFTGDGGMLKLTLSADRISVFNITSKNHFIRAADGVSDHASLMWLDANSQLFVRNGIDGSPITKDKSWYLAKIDGAGGAVDIDNFTDNGQFTSPTFKLAAGDPFDSPAAITRLSNITNYNGNKCWWQVGGKNHMPADGPPTGGTWSAGDTFWRRTPVAGGVQGDVCTTGGTVGSGAVFKTFGSVAA